MEWTSSRAQGVGRNPGHGPWMDSCLPRSPRSGILIVVRGGPAEVSDLPTFDAIVYTTHLRPCTTCSHPRGSHPDDGPCSTPSCTCGRYRE